MNQPIRLRNVLESVLSLLPFDIAIKIVNLLLTSQGFGSGARIETSGEVDAVARLFSHRVNERLTIFDVGANRGEYCKGILDKFPNCTIFAFEPSPTTFSLLEKYLEDEPRVKMFNFGLGETIEQRNLYKESQYAKIGSLTKLNVTDDRYTENVSIRTVDQVFEDLQLTYIDVLKIDVEGHEFEVMRGGTNIIEKNKVKIIQFELGGSSIDNKTNLKEMYDWLDKIGFKIYLIKPRGLQYLPSYNYQYEQYSTTNFLAVLNES